MRVLRILLSFRARAFLPTRAVLPQKMSKMGERAESSQNTVDKMGEMVYYNCNVCAACAYAEFVNMTQEIYI